MSKRETRKTRNKKREALFSLTKYLLKKAANKAVIEARRAAKKKES